MKTTMENQKKTTAVIYARVSSKEQEETGYSLDAQEKLLREYGERSDFDIVKVFRVTESASKWQIRRTLQEMLDYMTKNDIGVVLCEKIDRLTRNLKDAATVDDWVREDEGRAVHFVKENFFLNSNTRAHENFVWDMKVAMARFYTNNLSEEVRKGQKEKASQGWLPTKPPLGYKTIGEKGHKVHVIDKDVAPYVKEMFALYATGNYSVMSLANKMYKLGFRSRNGGRVVKSKVHKLLGDPFYYGKFVWKGQLHKGQHEPIVDHDLFDQVQAKLCRPSGPYHNKHYRELRGKVNCGSCGKTVTWEQQKGHWYGACKQCKSQLGTERKYIRQEKLESALMAKMTAVAPQNERVLSILQTALKESHSEEITLHETQVNGINASLQRIQQRKRAMYDDKLDGRITADFYDQRLVEFQQEEELLTESLKKLKSDNTEYYKVGAAIHELAVSADKIYLSNNATIEERRLLLAYAFERVSVLKGTVEVEYTKAFCFLSEWMPKVTENLELVGKTPESPNSKDASLLRSPILPSIEFETGSNSRTTENPLYKGRSDDSDSGIICLLRGQDSNLRPIG